MDNILDMILTADPSQLSQIKQAVKQREEILLQRTLNDLMKGSKVKFNNKTRPKYLVGLEAEVTKVNAKSVKVKIDDSESARRYGHGEIRVPFSLIEVA